jgi:hypothetical protein
MVPYDTARGVCSGKVLVEFMVRLGGVNTVRTHNWIMSVVLYNGENACVHLVWKPKFSVGCATEFNCSKICLIQFTFLLFFVSPV